MEQEQIVIRDRTLLRNIDLIFSSNDLLSLNTYIIGESLNKDAVFSRFRKTLLHESIVRRKTDIFDTLLNAHNVDQSIQDVNGKTALHYACERGLIFFVKKFVSYIHFLVICNIQDNTGMTPLLLAYKKNHFPICKLLLTSGVDYHLISNTGFRIPQTFINETFETSDERRIRLLHVRTNTRSRIRSLLDEREREIRRLQVIPMRTTEIRNERNIVYNYSTPVSPLVEPRKDIPKPRKEIIDMIINDAITKEEKCPIELEILTIENSVLTSCYHVFTKNSISVWLSTHKKCPVCREECIIWN
jgi:hypothetical protein